MCEKYNENQCEEYYENQSLFSGSKQIYAYIDHNLNRKFRKQLTLFLWPSIHIVFNLILLPKNENVSSYQYRQCTECLKYISYSQGINYLFYNVLKPGTAVYPAMYWKLAAWLLFCGAELQLETYFTSCLNSQFGT